MDIKKRLIIMFIAFICVVCGLVLGYSVYNDDRMISSAALPESITAFIKEHFPERQIISAEVDLLEHKVWLNDNTLIEFEWNRNWEKVESYSSSIPSELIPVAIISHMHQIDENAIISKISKEGFGYEVQVTGSPYVYRFNKSGQYMGLDD